MKCVQADGKIRSLIGYAAHFLPPSEYLAEIELFHCNTPVSSLKVSICCILKYVLLIRSRKWQALHRIVCLTSSSVTARKIGTYMRLMHFMAHLSGVTRSVAP